MPSLILTCSNLTQQHQPSLKRKSRSPLSEADGLQRQILRSLCGLSLARWPRTHQPPQSYTMKLVTICLTLYSKSISLSRTDAHRMMRPTQSFTAMKPLCPTTAAVIKSASTSLNMTTHTSVNGRYKLGSILTASQARLMSQSLSRTHALGQRSLNFNQFGLTITLRK